MTTRTTRSQRLAEQIVETDRRQAVAAAEDAVIARALELAPLSWSDAAALPAGGIGAALAGCDAPTLRLQAVRFLAERGRPWGWGDVDRLEAWLVAEIAKAPARAEAPEQQEGGQPAKDARPLPTKESTTVEIDLSVMVALSTAFKLVHRADAAARRAADNAVEHLEQAPVLAFDAVELRVQSQSRGQAVEHVADAEGCSCDGARHPWCKHRAELRLLLAELALRDPAELIRRIVEQAAPVAAEAAEPVIGARAAATIAEVTRAPFDPADDAFYADLVAGIAPAMRRAA